MCSKVGHCYQVGEWVFVTEILPVQKQKTEKCFKKRAEQTELHTPKEANKIRTEKCLLGLEPRGHWIPEVRRKEGEGQMRGAEAKKGSKGSC